MIPVDLNATYTYSLKNDRDNPPTIFHLGYLEPEVETWIQDRATNYEMNTKGKNEKADVVVSASRLNYDYVRFALRGVDNFNDAGGQPVPFSTDSEGIPKLGPRNVASKQFMRLAFSGRLKEIAELAEIIRKRNQLSEEEEKN